MVALIVPTGYLWTKLGGLQVTMMVIYVVVLAGSILLSFLPASVTRGLAHAANAIIAQRLWLVISVLTTTVVAYGISYTCGGANGLYDIERGCRKVGRDTS